MSADLSQAEVRAALCVGEDSLFWKAIHQLIEVQAENAIVETLDPDNQGKPHLLNYYAGAAAHLRTLQYFLIAEREAGLQSVKESD